MVRMVVLPHLLLLLPLTNTLPSPLLSSTDPREEEEPILTPLAVVGSHGIGEFKLLEANRGKVCQK